MSNSKKNSRQMMEFEIVDNIISNTTNTRINNYEILRTKYTGNIIPIDLINYIIEYFFKKSLIVHKYEQNILLVSIPISSLLEAPIVNWCQNREPDLIRIPDIASYIYNKHKPIETILYLSFNNKKQQFDIIDGIHRFSALKYIKEKNSAPLDLINEPEFGSNNDASWLYNSYIVINIRFNADIGELITLRDSLNKTQPMPTVLMDDNTSETFIRKDIIEKIATEWQVKYTKSFSSSNDDGYLKSNGLTNRTKFSTLLGTLYDKYNIDITRINILRQILEEGNKNMQEKVLKTMIGSAKARLRCKETGCYLFIYRNDQLEDML